ncbi:response regulator transcription factor [Duganella guangzhouensis]|nr:response regulator transcription factor [Duganella guangzhouensis]
MEFQIKVLLVEDDSDLRDSVVEWLEIEGMNVIGVSTATDFYHAIARTHFDIAVVDIGLPDQEGYVLAEYIRSNTNMGVIILTARGAIEDKLKGYHSGADLYLVKPVDCRELSAVIVSIADRVQKCRNEIPVVTASWVISLNQWELSFSNYFRISLTLKELMFLESLAVSPGSPVKKKIILEKIYQRNDFYSSRSLDSLVRRLRSKIEQAGMNIPIKTVHSVGYCFAGDIILNEGDLDQ